MFLFNASYINMRLQADCNMYGDGHCIMDMLARRAMPDGLYIGSLHGNDDDASCDSGEVAMMPMGTLHSCTFLGDADHFRTKLRAIGHRFTKPQMSKLNEMVTLHVDD